MEEQGVPMPYILLLQKLYSDQVGVITLDKTSREFPIIRGTKRGYLLNPTLLNAVFECQFRPLKSRWQSNSCGFMLENRRFTNLHFADDVLLVSNTLAVLKLVLGDVAAACSAHGSSLRPGNTSILTNLRARRGESVQMYIYLDIAIYLYLWYFYRYTCEGWTLSF
ncbi:unnamed protein product [Prorocentrum cordatum]|uniref:Reverse transcriptase domain-containing protein n=1 Tax=Prorocentrum cordatum TaxID=2364126 RepID=A0ABN9QKX2_9DINO|nr:unnamed protein product [Polarella glacialis]